MFDDKVLEIPVKRYLRVDADGNLQLPPGLSGSIESADGRNGKGGFGYNGGIDLQSDEANQSDDAVVFDLNYSWTTPAQVGGSVHETVRAKVGVPVSIQLSDGRKFSAAWRMVKTP
jgi:hypothetical protein